MDLVASKVVYYVNQQLHQKLVKFFSLKISEIFRKLPKSYISGRSFNKK